MNILKILTKKDLKQNKKRTIGTLIGILLATALITVVGGMLFVLQNTLLQGTINQDGYYHIMLTDLTNQDVKDVSLNKDFSHMEVVQDLGEFNICDEYDSCFDVNIISESKDTFDYLKRKLIDGVYPKNSNEILITDYYAKTFDNKIGDIITISDKEYKVVGVTSNYNTLITTKASSDNNSVYLTLKNPKNYKKDFSELLGVNDYSKDDNNKYGFKVNQELLRYEVFAFSDRISSMLVSLVTIIIGIILATSVFSIRNSFAISTNEKLKTYGMLSSIGATKKQIRKMVLFEGLYLGIIGISLGLLLGGFVTWFLTFIINYLTTSANMVSEGWAFYYKFSIYPFIIAIIVGFVMIYLSTLSSSIKASRVSPIQNIRNSDNIKNPKKLRVPFFVRKIFRVGGTLSYKNLKRSKRKYRVTVISLTVSILVFIVAASLLEYGLKEVRNEYGSLNYDVEVNANNSENGFAENLKSLTSLAKSHVLYRRKYVENENYNYLLFDTSHITNNQTIGKMCFEHDDSYECTGDKIDYVYMMSYYYDDNSFKEVCKKLHIDYDKNKDKVIVIDDAIINRKKVRLTDYKKDDTITLKDYEHNSTISYKVAEVSDIRTWGMETNYDPIISVIANAKYYKGNDKLAPDTIYYETKDASKLVDDIEKISSDYYISNVAELVKQLKTMILIFSIFIYGFIIVVTLIGVTSVFNTINSNMELRRREFATLKSIGMTKREFNNMILLEAVFYSFKSLFFGIILGLGGSYLVYNAFKNNMDYGYLVPIKAIIISIIFIVLLVYLIMKYSISRVNKENIIETIRKENV